MKIMSTFQPIRQRGLATLAVTLILVFIATIAVLYASRNAFIFQKSSSNQYQYLKSFEAAEAGANELAAQVEADLALLSDSNTSNDGSTIILQKSTAASGSGSCFSNLGQQPYEFKAPYAASGNTKLFAADRYFTQRVALLDSTGLSDPNLAYRARASIEGSKVNIYSEGCADESVATPTSNSPACADGSQPKALIRRSAQLTGGITYGGSALTTKDYFDMRGSITVDKPNPAAPAPACAVLVGDSYTFGGTQSLSAGSLEQNTGLNALSEADFFSKIFGGETKASLKAKADAGATASPPTAIVVTDGSCPSSVASTVKLVWYEGNLSSNCTIGGGKTVIVNGNITASVTVTGFLYGQNVLLNGAAQVIGAAAFGGYVDAAALGTLLPTYIGTNVTNGKTDGDNPSLSTTHAAQGALHVTYDPSAIHPPTDITANSATGSWIDF
ncbi:pilus assembly PilX N-terminal domain-containing protein [Jeongeupia wiesaeckerbachi]|uniref:pilus assembly PilX family protein n=1 Tax=Jeongeupia wiesaeckerbachi TaxID=3051218 RepID=UPI003D8036BB